MSKCNLLSPVQNVTGTFFTFSQYSQDLTKQYSQSDQYRCIPSKFAAVNLDLSLIDGYAPSENLGEIFQNYFENACAFFRTQPEGIQWCPENARTLLFQTLERYGLITISQENGNLYSENVKYIGDINIYSNQDIDDGVGYNEIYCYIPNDAQEHKYLFTEAANPTNYSIYPNEATILGYNPSDTAWNGLSWSLGEGIYAEYIDNYNYYSIGRYGYDSESAESSITAIPDVLEENEIDSNDITVDSSSFSANAIILFYDIVKHGQEDDQVLYKNIPLGIYFTGAPTPVGDSKDLTNKINKYVLSEDAYNQGTSYGLRVCSRFLAMPNNTLNVTTDVETLSGVADIAPLLQKMGEVIDSAKKVVDEDAKTYALIKEHLDMFKNNNTNIPYIREVGNRKFWFVNGKNTGAVAQFDVSSEDELVQKIVEKISEQFIRKTELNNRLELYTTTNVLEQNFYSKSEVNDIINDLEEKLKIYTQGE